MSNKYGFRKAIGLYKVARDSAAEKALSQAPGVPTRDSDMWPEDQVKKAVENQELDFYRNLMVEDASGLQRRMVRAEYLWQQHKDRMKRGKNHDHA